MAVDRILFGVGLLQIVTSLCSIAFCTRHYSDTEHMKTTIAHVSVMFIVRGLPSISLLVCGIMATVISCVKNVVVRIVHTTATCQTTIGIAINVWFFAYQSHTSPMKYDRGSAGKCLIAACLCLIVCLLYLTYLVIQVCRSRQSSNKLDERSHIYDVESATKSSPSDQHDMIKSAPRTLVTLQLPTKE